MPLYDVRCNKCGWETEIQIPLQDFDKKLWCVSCGGEMDHIISTPILTCLPPNQRRWGTSLYRRHEKGEKIGKEKRREVK